MTTPDPAPLGELFAGMAARGAAIDAQRAPLDPSRIGAQRTPLPRHVRTAVLLRDRFTCRWCHATGRRDHPSFEIDHIVPWSAGGADHPVNLRTLCRGCNQDRSNRVTEYDRRALPIVLDCTTSDAEAAAAASFITVFCLGCRAVHVAPYLADLLVAGAVPDIGVPQLRDGDEDYASLDARHPSVVRAARRLAERVGAQDVDCPWCAAPVGKLCVGVSGLPLVRSSAHPARIEAAAVAEVPPS